MSKSVALLGATGHVGSMCLDVIRSFSKKFRLDLISFHSNVQSASKIVKEFQPKYILASKEKVSDVFIFSQISNEVCSNGNGAEVITSIEELKIDYKFDISIVCVSGFAGLAAAISIIPNTKKLILVNKESIICGFDIIKKMCKEHNVKILPADSEHNSIYYIMSGIKRSCIESITITASGGVFFNSDKKEKSVGMERMNPESALDHPVWKMGAKNTIDSSTFFNKAIEIVEAANLFQIDIDLIDAVVHPQAQMHCAINMKDGRSICSFSKPHMSLHISDCMFDNCHQKPNLLGHVDFIKARKMEFYPLPDHGLRLIKKTKEMFKQSPPIIIAMNAADEIAIDYFLNKKIEFYQIIDVILECAKSFLHQKNVSSLKEILDIDRYARVVAKKIIDKLKK